jgi:hypothetical protein
MFWQIILIKEVLIVLHKHVVSKYESARIIVR